MKKVFKEIQSNTTQVIWDVILIFTDDGEFEPEASSCTCPNGALFRWMKINPKWPCSHVNEALDIYDEEQRNKFMEVINGRK